MMNKKLLIDGLEELNISLASSQIVQLIKFEKEISVFNDLYRLVNAKDDELIIKHFLDSLAPLPIITSLLQEKESPLRCADIGSGGGFPAIPLAIALESTSWSLIERSKKRCGFLENAVASCNLYNRVEVIDKDLKEVRQKYELITFRAFASINDILTHLQTIIADDGVICAYKGKVETTLDELQSIGNVVGDEESGIAGPFSYSIKPVTVPFLDAERHVLLLSLMKKGE